MIFADTPVVPSWDAFSCFLTAISILLTGIAIVLVFGGWFALMHFGDKAKKQAEKVAKNEAQKIAVKIATEYCEKNMPDIVAAYLDLRRGVSGAEADAIASEGQT
jgi:hypothetical protein